MVRPLVMYTLAAAFGKGFSSEEQMNTMLSRVQVLLKERVKRLCFGLDTKMAVNVGLLDLEYFGLELIFYKRIGAK
jgi:hypothetical protein